MCGSYNCRPMNTTKRLKNDPVVHQTVKQWKSLVTKVTLCNACACTHIQTHTHTRTHAHARTHAYTHTYAYTQAHTHSHTFPTFYAKWQETCGCRNALSDRHDTSWALCELTLCESHRTAKKNKKQEGHDYRQYLSLCLFFVCQCELWFVSITFVCLFEGFGWGMFVFRSVRTGMPICRHPAWLLPTV